MSVWYHTDLTVIGSPESIAKFLNLPPGSTRTDSIKLSFGQKNGPAVRVFDLAEKNPDVIFLEHTGIECDTNTWSLFNFNKDKGEMQYIPLQNTGWTINEINKKMFKIYEAKYPKLVARHIQDPVYENFDWECLFCDYSKCLQYLNDCSEYKEMITPMTEDDYSGGMEEDDDDN